jgi:hypothetical protein
LSDSLARYLQALGLERRQRVKSIDSWIAEALDETDAEHDATGAVEAQGGVTSTPSDAEALPHLDRHEEDA